MGEKIWIFFCLGFTFFPGSHDHTVVTGLDAVVASGCKEFRGKKVGIITNQTGVDRHGRHIVDLFQQAEGVQLVALFGPEHGIRGRAEAGEQIQSRSDSATGLPVFSLYGATRKPTPEMLAGLEALIFDMQDVGARFYTYISTMSLAMSAAAEAGIDFYVLDRPNPISGKVEGPLLDLQFRSFVGMHPLALRHGMTIGELAQMFLGEKWIWDDVDSAAISRARSWSKLHVIHLQNWKREHFFAGTGLNWIAPSPNMPTPETALLYPGTCLLEATNVSEGRGTAQPFEMFGAPWLNAVKLEGLLERQVAGIELTLTSFTPVDLPGKAMNPKFETQMCQGLQLKVTDPARFEAVKFGVTLLWALQQLHSEEFVIAETGLARLSGVSWLREMILAGESLAAIWQRMENEAEEFRKLRTKYLIYD